MEFRVGRSRIELIVGDITRQDTAAIVNAANSGLIPGGGVDGAIRRAAGPSVTEETRTIGGCPTGQARMTGAGKLAASGIIHAVGPVYASYPAPEARRLLASAYVSSLALASEAGLKSIAFPAISSGIYGYPMKESAQAALGAVREWLLSHPEVELVRFVLLDVETRSIWVRAMEETMGRAD